jgi:threonine/homoserine/homoserine lactone efflux protein
MFSAVTAGVVLGATAGFAPGPLLTLVITQTLRHGVGEGIKVALAPLITDLPIILGSLFLLAQISDSGKLLGVISFAGGLYLLYLAYGCLRSGPLPRERQQVQPASLKKGSLVNALNPHPYLFWMTVGSPLLMKFHDQHALSPWGFLVCFYLLLVGSKVLLAVLVSRFGAILSSSGYGMVLRGLGIALGFFAILLVRDGLTFWGVW